MEWSRKIGSVQGIPIRIHLTIGLLALWFLLVGANTLEEQFYELTTLALLLTSVVLHELGHALMAKRLGIRTRDITLYPFGGVAALLDSVNAKQELLITIAGPLVNVLIVAVIALIMEPNAIWASGFMHTPVGSLFSINVALAVFNILPAFPMDGGRILRSVLQLLNIRSATAIAVRISQVLCIVLAGAAFVYSHPVLLIIATFVFASASREMVLGTVQERSPDFTASQVMVPLASMLTLTPSLTLEAAARVVLRSVQTYFPVCIGKRILGLVDRETLLQRACNSVDEQYVTEVMMRDIPSCQPTTPLGDLLSAFEQHKRPAMLVGSEDACDGILFFDQLDDLLLVHEMLRQNREQRDYERELGEP